MDVSSVRSRDEHRWSERLLLSTVDDHILTIKRKLRYCRIGISIGVFMDDPNTDVIQGTLDMLILKTVSLEPMHGFGISRRVEQVSRGVFKVNPGSSYSPP